MAKVFGLDGLPGPRAIPPVTPRIATLRMTTGMDPEQFSEALSSELGWAVPVLVYLAWERADGSVPPAAVMRAAQRVASTHPLGEFSVAGTSRRNFLAGAISL